MKRVQAEEEHQQQLKKRLKKLHQEKVDLENKLEREQEYVLHKLSRELHNAMATKEALQKKVEAELKAKDELQAKLEEDEKQRKNTLQAKLEELKRDKVEIEAQRDQEVELTMGKLANILERLVHERKYAAFTTTGKSS